MTQPAPTSCLNLHAAYACEHAGACCTAGWAIPIEEPAYQVVEAHFRGRRPSGALFRTSGSLPPEAAAMLGTAHDGTCVFFEADHGRLCSIHRELGEERLPSACRHFPRVVLHDARGCLISLSHFCPTAARMLFAALPLQIVEAPSSLALNGTLEGLDARDVLPPLLRGDMLADVDGYGAWERSAIATLARNDLTSGQAIARIARATTAIQSWRPGGPSLRTIVEAEFDVASGGEASEDEALDDADADERRVMDALDSIPVGLTHLPRVDVRPESALVTAWWREHDRGMRHYLAARLFGNWIAYYGSGLQTIVEYLRTCRAVLMMETARLRAQSPSSFSTASAWQTVIPAIQNADLLLVHLSDAKKLAKRLG